MLPRVPGSAPRRAEQVWGKVGCPALPLHQAGERGLALAVCPEGPAPH